MKARELAQGKWASILPQLGVPAECLTGKHCPCPRNGEGTDRFRFADRDGTGSFFCECSDGARGGLGLLMCVNGWDFVKAAKEVEAIVGEATAAPTPSVVAADPRRSLRAVQSKLQPVGDAVRDYLSTRGLEPPPGLRQARLRYCEDGKPTGEFDAMVARVVDPAGAPLTFHVTYIQNGLKAPVKAPRKLMTPLSPIRGGCVRLFPAAEELAIAEGIESALAAHAMFGRPTWAALNASMLAAWEPPTGVRRVHILGDNDANFTGQRAAYALANRLAKREIECSVHVPPRSGWDYNDVLLDRPEAA